VTSRERAEAWLASRDDLYMEGDSQIQHYGARGEADAESLAAAFDEHAAEIHASYAEYAKQHYEDRENWKDAEQLTFVLTDENERLRAELEQARKVIEAARELAEEDGYWERELLREALALYDKARGGK